jgi:hypothetical protein
MSRNPELDAILQARYDLETCEPGQKTERRARLLALIEAAISKAGLKHTTYRQFSEITAEPISSVQAREKAGRTTPALAASLSAQLGPVSVAGAGELEKERPVIASARQMEHAATRWQAMSP